jgi:hypothetical protein
MNITTMDARSLYGVLYLHNVLGAFERGDQDHGVGSIVVAETILQQRI